MWCIDAIGERICYVLFYLAHMLVPGAGLCFYSGILDLVAFWIVPLLLPLYLFRIRKRMGWSRKLVAGLVMLQFCGIAIYCFKYFFYMHPVAFLLDSLKAAGMTLIVVAGMVFG